MPNNSFIDPRDGINSSVEHKNFAMLVMNTVYAEKSISAKRVKSVTGLDIDHAATLLQDLENSGVLVKNSVGKYEPVISKANWFERSYEFFEEHS